MRSAISMPTPAMGKSAPHHGMPQGTCRSLAIVGHDQPSVLTAESEKMVASIAAHVAIAIENARAAEREVANEPSRAGSSSAYRDRGVLRGCNPVDGRKWRSSHQLECRSQANLRLNRRNGRGTASYLLDSR